MQESSSPLPTINNPAFFADKPGVAPVEEFSAFIDETMQHQRDNIRANLERLRNAAQNRLAFEEAELSLTGSLRRRTRFYYGQMF